jgi:chondroitin 4-sulfotransferase 11
VKYRITHSNKQKYVWFRTAKCGTRSVLNTLENNTQICTGKSKISNLDESFGDYFKFTIVRNPWDRLVSCWKNKIEAKRVETRKFYYDVLGFDNPIGLTFENFVKCLNVDKLLYADEHWMPLHSMIELNSVDFIGRFENLQEDFNTICDKIGIPRQELPHKNKTKHKHYTEYYDSETKQIVAEKYAKDIEYFNYKFGE